MPIPRRRIPARRTHGVFIQQYAMRAYDDREHFPRALARGRIHAAAAETLHDAV
ncbi:hypothetical protein ACWEKT_37190 [Nocardia takedensis]